MSDDQKSPAGSPASAPSTQDSAQGSMQQERDASIRALERKARRRHAGVRWPAALVGIALGLGGLWWTGPEVAYFFSPRQPITLGTEGDYHFDLLQSNRYVQVHGTPTSRAAYSREGSTTFVHVGLTSTPLMVRRRALPNEDWIPGRPALQPDQRPFGVRGRLLREDDAGRYARGFEIVREIANVVPDHGKLWVIVEGEAPGGFSTDLLLAGVMVAFVLLNCFFFVRDLRARLLRPAG